MIHKMYEVYLGSALAPGEQDSTQASNYKGNWDASTNTPTLVNGVGKAGDFYICTVAGTCDFGAGAITFEENDWVVYTGEAWVVNKAVGEIINDNTIDTQLTWSSHKINAEIQGLLDDNFTSTNTTWSSSKIQQAINTGTPEDVYIYKGEIEELPESAVLGNVYKCNNVLYWWNGTAFEPFENIRSISVNGTAQTITNGNVDITVPTQTSDLTNDSGFIDKTVNDLDNYYTESETDTLLSAKQPKTLEAPITVDGTIETTVEGTLSALNSAKANSSSLATVATTGDYTDLSNTPTLGTASAKDFTDNVRPNSHDLVESGAVYNAIINSVSSIYTPRGSLSCAELTSALLIEANVGNVYEMSDSGTTSALFLQGAGETINVGDNVGIIKAGESTILFNLMANAFDLTDYQKQDLSSAITIGGVSQTTVEGALGGLNSLIPSNASTSNKLATIGDITGTDYLDELSGAIDLNNYLENKVYIARNGTITSVSNAPDISSSYLNAGFGLQVYSYGSSNESNSAFVTQIFTAYPTGDMYYRSRSWGGSGFIWSSWNKVATTRQLNSLLNNKMSCYTWGTDKTLRAVFYEITDQGIMPDVTDAVGKRIIARYGNTLINRITQVNGIKNFYWDNTLVLSCPWNDDTTKLTDTLEIFVGTTGWQQFATIDNLTRVTESEYQLQTGGDNYVWFDLGTSPNTGNSQAFLFYEITYGRVDGLQSKILVSCGGTMTDGNYFKIVNLNNAQTSASEQFKIDSNKHLWLGMQSYCEAHVKVYGRWTGMGNKTTVEPTGTVLPIHKCVTESDLTSSVISGSTVPITSGGVYDYLAGSPLIGQVTTTLGRLGFGALADNFLEIKVCPSIEITNNPFGDSGNCLYIKMGIVEFVVGALSADASQWTPNTGVAYRVRHGIVWQSWHTLTQN